MDKVFTIDVPTLCNPEKFGIQIGMPSYILKSLRQIKGTCFLFRNEMWGILNPKSLEYHFIISALSSLSKKNYEEALRIPDIVTSPVLTADAFSSEMNAEIQLQVSVMHHDAITSANTRYFLCFPQRWNGGQQYLTTTDKQAEAKHPAIIVAQEKDWDEYVSQHFRPKLVQLKHGVQSWKRSGEHVSPFTSYDPRNSKIAEEILQQAFDDYEPQAGTSDYFPDRLYTWDKQTKTYVEFRLSGKNEYHGFDQKDTSVIPDYIKEKYLH